LRPVSILFQFNFVSNSGLPASGLLIRASRKQLKIRMDEVAGSAGVGPLFVRSWPGTA